MSTTTELPYSAVTSDPAKPLIDPAQPIAADAGQISGGYATVTDMAALYAVPAGLRKVGMRRKVLGDDGSGVFGRVFELLADMATWSGMTTQDELRLALIARASFVPPNKPTVYKNAVRDRFNSANARRYGFTPNASLFDAGTVSLAYNDDLFTNVGEPDELRVACTVSQATSGPRQSIDVSIADLAKVGLVPSDSAPSLFSAMGSIRLDTLVNQNIGGTNNNAGTWTVYLCYRGAGASIAGAPDNTTDVGFAFNNTTPAAFGSGDAVWNGSTGYASVVGNEKLAWRAGVPLRASYNGKALSGVKMVFVGNAIAAGASAFSISRVALVPGATIDTTKVFINRPEDDVSQVFNRNLEPNLLAQIVGAAQAGAVATALAAKSDAVVPGAPTTYVNAARNRFYANNGTRYSYTTNASLFDAGTLSLAYNAAVLATGEPCEIRAACTATQAVTAPRVTFDVSLDDLAKAGLVASDAAPPLFSAMGSIRLDTLVNQNIAGANNGNGTWTLYLCYRGAGVSIAGTTDNTTDVGFAYNGTTPITFGNGDAVWNGSTGYASVVGNEKLAWRAGVPLRASYNGKALSGVKMVFIGNAVSAGAAAFSVSRIALIAGATIDTTKVFLNLPEDNVSQVFRRNIDPALLALIDNAAPLSALAGKVDAIAPLEPSATVNAVTNRYGISSAPPAGYGGGGTSSGAFAGNGSWRALTGELNVLELADTAGAAGAALPFGGFFISPAQLAAAGITPDDTNPPLIDLRAAIVRSGCVNVDVPSGGGGTRIWFVLRYQGANGSASLGFPAGGDTSQIIFTDGLTGPRTNYGGSADARWSGIASGAVYDANQKVHYRQAVPLPATFNGQALTGVLVLVGGQATAAGAAKVQLGRVAVRLRTTALSTTDLYLNGSDTSLAQLAQALAAETSRATKAETALAAQIGTGGGGTSNFNKTVEKLRLLAYRAERDNPFDRPIMDSAPAITMAAAKDTATYPQRINFAPGGVINPNLPVTVIGGKLYAGSGGSSGMAYVCSLSQPTSGNCTSLGLGADTATLQRVWNAFEIFSDAQALEIELDSYHTPGFKLLVNDQYVTKAYTQVVGGTGVIRIPFATAAHRKIRLETKGGIISLGLGLTDYVAPTSTSDRAKVLWVGDSFSRGGGMHSPDGDDNDMSGNLPFVVGQLLGWNVHVAGIGGTGFYADNHGTMNNYRTRLTAGPGLVALHGQPEAVGFQLSQNDFNSGAGSSAVNAEAILCLKAYRAAFPNALFIVFGCYSQATGPSAAFIAFEQSFAAAFANWGDPLSFFVPVTTANPPFFKGTGYVGATNGSGVTDKYLDVDGSHPYGPVGHEYIGRRAAIGVRQGLASL